MIWRPALFFITIVFATPSGRAAANGCANQVMAMLADQAPYSYVVLVCVAFITLVCLLMMHDWRREKPGTQVIRREIRYEFGQMPSRIQPVRPVLVSRTTKLQQFLQFTRRILYAVPFCSFPE